MAKHVVFVLDISGSMKGKKMHQTRSALGAILAELRRDVDRFSLVVFADEVHVWASSADKEEKDVVMVATDENVDAAMQYVEDIEPGGKTLLCVKKTTPSLTREATTTEATSFQTF